MDIRKERRKRGWSQDELANLLGVSRGTIVNYENKGVIPVSKRPILNRIFGKNEEEEIVEDVVLYLEYEGVKVPVQEIALFFAENHKDILRHKLFRMTIDKIVAERLNKQLKEIILDFSMKK